MRVIEVSNKVYLVRHWLRWYRVQRGGSQWERLEPIIKTGRRPRVATIESAAASLRQAKPSSISMPSIDI